MGRRRDQKKCATLRDGKTAIAMRAYQLWVEAGQPGVGTSGEIHQMAQFVASAEIEHNAQALYHYRNDGAGLFVYYKDADTNFTAALGFLKDWVTSVIQFEAGALAVFGLAAGFKDIFSPPSPAPSGVASGGVILVELSLIVISATAILISMGYGITLLNALPGAAQRCPVNITAHHSDVYSIRNEPSHRSLASMTKRFRITFIVGVTFFALCVLVRLMEQSLKAICG